MAPAAVHEPPAATTKATSDEVARPRGIGRLLRRRGRFDAQPTQPAEVLLASYGGSFSKASIREALALSGGCPVAVVIVARVYGSAFGLPNPGLLPSRKELAEQRDKVQKAVTAIERRKQEGSGQVAVSRRPAKAIGRAAMAHGVSHVVLCTPTPQRWRRALEGDPLKEVRRRVGAGISVTQVA